MTARRNLLRRAGELIAALVVAAGVGTATFVAVDAIPFVEPSWLPETFGGTLAVGMVVVTGWLLLRSATGARGLWILGTVAPAFLASSHLTLLLNGTPHYLFGLGGDQINRVAYLTRFRDSPGLADPFYADAAPFYPPQWFWVGGQLARIAGVEGWVFYKPYAIITMAVAGAIAFVAWKWLVPPRLAVLFGLLTSVIGVHTNAYEPYSWILICLLPQVVVATFLLGARLVAGDPGEHQPPEPTWPLVVTIGFYLGMAALGYTLIAGFAAMMVGLVVLIHAWHARAERSAVLALLGRLAAMAGISAAIALLFWHRYLLAVLGGAQTEPTVANDFAPEVSSRWPLPMFESSAAGVLCLIGLVWIVVTVWPAGADHTVGRAATSLHARIHTDDSGEAAPSPASEPLPTADRQLTLGRAFGLTAAAVLGWYVLSGLRAVVGSTLLPFRMIPIITLVLALAGVIGALALARWALTTSPDRSRGRVLAAAVVVAGLAAVQLVQHVSEEDAEFASAARAFPPVPRDVLGALDEMTGDRAPSDVVLLTSDPTLYAYRPYFTFQGPAQAYATPAARYEERLDEIRRWADAETPDQLAAAMDASAFRGPDALVLEREGSRRWVFPAAVNAMPRVHNNTREEIVFRPRQLENSPHFDVRRVGDRMVVVRR